MNKTSGRGAGLLCVGGLLALLAACNPSSEHISQEASSAEMAPMTAEMPDARGAPSAMEDAIHDETADMHDTHSEDHSEEHSDAEAEHHDHAGGEAHVHGTAELAVTQEDNFITINVDAPLANFGLSEATKKKDTDFEQYAEGLTELMGDARCDLVERSAAIRRNGDHAALTLSIVWDCRRPSRLDGLMFTGFDLYPGFEKVSSVFLGADKQTSATLTPASPFLPFSQ
ncbi:ZrgA family zinc uptake protein [Hyphomonas pacifica]|uniref:ZrgA family zinc uptake protein n=1 Tax=Hyphomonas pacifica TaxID=1280941 RepID=UPI000DBFFB68|nr:DUF2796 domain-containing protein [Hyphomonas pacifica]RAN36812.1 hypothetical protein HY11_11250 [Hyphomonas pacifica]